MSFQAMTWAVAQRTGSSLKKLLLLTCANYASDRGACWPSQATLAADAEMSPRTVRAHLAELEQDRFLRREERRGKAGRRTSDMIFLAMPGGDYYRQEVPVDSRQEAPVASRQEVPVDGFPSAAPNALSSNGHSPKFDEEPPAARAGEPSEPVNSESSSRARAGCPDGPPREREDLQPTAPANAHWRATEPALRRRFGEKAWRCWLAPLICARDEGSGKVMTLWAPSAFVRDRIARDFGDKLGQLLAREIQVVVVPPHQRHVARQELEEDAKAGG